jgi:hypothetical protein
MDSEFGSQIQVYMGRGDGTFTTLPTFYGGYKPITIAVSDANADGIRDVAIGNQGDRNIALFFGNGDGTFTAGPLIPNVYAAAVELADLDGDGIRDLIASRYDSACVSVWPGLGSGAFGPPSSFGTRSYPVMIRVADLNHDGMPDLVIGRMYNDVVDVLLNQTVPTLHVHAHTDVALSVESCRWDATARAFDARLSLASSMRASVQIIDVSGRIVAEDRWSPMGAGPQRRVITALSRPPSGMYWARLSQGGRVATRRVLVID